MFSTPSLAPVVRERLYEQVAQQIQELIIAHGWPAGNRIPTERELGEQFGVSRTVVREALKALSERGLVIIRPGRGTFVADMGAASLSEPMRLFFQRHNVSYEDLVEARRVLEVEISALAAERAESDQMSELEAAIERMDLALERSDREQYVDADQQFHSVLAQSTQNKMFVMLTESISGLLRESRRLIFDVVGAPTRGQQHHRALLNSIQRGDVPGAQRAMREHLNQVDLDIHMVEVENGAN
jgi:GntR family transcriptional regulator, transcriptional repressor for pyruvate dehydrogenase complex